MPEDTHPLVEALIGNRLLVTRLEKDEATVEVAHEALLRVWETLGAVLREERDKLLVLERVR